LACCCREEPRHSRRRRILRRTPDSSGAPCGFTPFLAITEIGVDTNVFNDAEEPQRDTTATFGPGAEYWVRAGRARVSAKSDVQYNWFRDFASQRSLSTNNDLKIEFPMARLTPFRRRRLRSWPRPSRLRDRHQGVPY
jgi:hypothetical protein